MFDPSRDDVRRFFCEAWRKHRQGMPVTPLEAIAVARIAQHPEYQALLESGDAALTAHFSVESGQSNPFLHLSMHLAIAEQLQIDQPPGIRAAYEQLVRRTGSEHDALHEIMECLGEVVWRAQRDRTPPDGDAYLDCMRRRATRH